MKKNRFADVPFEEQPRPDVAALEPKIITKLPENAAFVNFEPVVTVVSAVFNVVKEGRKEQLLQCLDSVQAQTGVVIEHLIIDGASQDGTADLVKNYRNAKIPIRLLSEADEGIYDAMNRGLWLARGKYVIFLNSDDFYSDPQGLSESVRRMEESGADFSYAPITVLDESSDKPVEHLLNHPNADVIFLEMPFSHQSMMIKKKALLEINGFDLRYRSGADYDSVLRLIFTGHRACFVSCRFVSFRLGGYSFVNVGESQQEVGTIYSRLYGKYLGVELSPEEGKNIYLTKQCSKELRKRQFRFARSAFGSIIGAGHAQDEAIMPEDLFIFQYQLHTIKDHPGIPVVLRIIAHMLFSSPVLFSRFLWKFLLYRRKLANKQAGKQAFLDLLYEEQEKRRKKRKSAPENNDASVLLTPSRLEVNFRDFWCVAGLYDGESWGAWTGRKFSVFFNLPKDYVNLPLTAEIQIGGYIFPESPKRTVEIIANGQSIGKLELENFLPQPCEIQIPPEIVASRKLDVDFVADAAFSPKSLGHSGDTRELAMTFRRFAIRKTSDSGNDGSHALPGDEIKVGFLNHFNKWWVGGITYFKNLFQAMATTESPRLRPFIFSPSDELAKCLLPYVSIFPMQPSSAATDHMPVAADYDVDVLSHLNGNQAAEGSDGIAWIADFQHVHLPEMFDQQEIDFRNHSFHTLIDRNRIVCLSSYDAMEDFRKYAPESAYKARCLHFVSIPEEEVYRISEAEAAEIRRSRNLPARYFYVPNQFWKHKNHIAVLKAVAVLKKAGLSIHVVFSGNTYDARFPHYFEELQAFCRQENIEENVHFLGLIPLKEVYFLMRDCLAMVNPSKFEGWSSSVEEAKSIGKTMFLSNLNVHYEQMPPRGIYFPVDDPEWLAGILKRAWNELKSGPDAVMEKQAREALPQRIRQFGEEFRQIVLDAMANRSAEETIPQFMPQLTVVTAVRNLIRNRKKEELIRTLESVTAQTGAAVEHLIADGGSEDGTLEFLHECAGKYGCRIVSEAAHGIYGLRNLGTIHADGKYVAFLNVGDVYAADDFLSKSVNALEKEDYDFSYVSEKQIENDCFTEMPFDFESMLIRRKALYGVAVYNDTFECAGDYDLLLRLVLSGKRGIRVACAGPCIADKAACDAESYRNECILIYSRLYGRRGFALTYEAAEQIYLEKKLPSALQELLSPCVAAAFGSADNVTAQ